MTLFLTAFGLMILKVISLDIEVSFKKAVQIYRVSARFLPGTSSEGKTVLRTAL
jgi:hypothetical protein